MQTQYTTQDIENMINNTQPVGEAVGLTPHKEREMTEEEAGMMYIEEEDLELARKVLEQAVQANSQAALCPEEYDDGQDDAGPTPLPEGEDYEKKLNELVDMQERMSRGMIMIGKTNTVIEGLFQSNKYMPAIYNAWKWYQVIKKETGLGYAHGVVNGTILPFLKGHCLYDPKEIQHARFVCNPLNKVPLAWLDRRSDLWDHWHILREECKEIVGTNSYLWVQYFRLPEEEINPYWTIGDPEKIDSQVQLKEMDWKEILWEQHMEEERGILASCSYEDRDEPMTTNTLNRAPRDLWRLGTWLEDRKSKWQAQQELQEIDTMILDATMPLEAMSEEELVSLEASMF